LRPRGFVWPAGGGGGGGAPPALGGIVLVGCSEEPVDDKAAVGGGGPELGGDSCNVEVSARKKVQVARDCARGCMCGHGVGWEVATGEGTSRCRVVGEGPEAEVPEGGGARRQRCPEAVVQRGELAGDVSVTGMSVPVLLYAA